ncbi:MAG: fluoride efflux transporter CrcB [Hahellaceae bacterium]|jgi:CrcB protein|nr:fluoride efflux transporter CrcB [Hahellaceae bacterium]MCP5212908.1 fluoride efflux transporter CrcB [Hahellaceae bacterium]
MTYQLVFIAMGGALGAVARYLAVAWMTEFFGKGFPYGTLFVNVLGSLIIGIAFVIIVEKMHTNAALRPLLMVGFLGAFTTFSTFSLETFSMIQDGKLIPAVAYIFCSVILCVLATSISVMGARLAFKVS